MSPRPLGVYIHIPFCRSKCLYCAFNSVAVKGFSPEKWVGLLGDELSSHLRGKDFSPETHMICSIYFGGGTPSLLPPSAVGELIRQIKNNFSHDENLEVTLEANPEGLGPDTLKGLLEAGVNRLSIGVQSLDARELKAIGRRHDAKEALEAVKNARQMGFDNLSLDLMYGLPGQSMESWERTLELILAQSAAHLSLYNLSIEEGTPFYKRHGGLKKNPFVDEELECAMYESAARKLRSAGYVHYEISNFAKPGFKSLHNEGYWLGREYLGLGPGAHSFSNSDLWGKRSWNEASIESYKKALLAGCPLAGFELLSREEARVEAVFLGLRMLEKGMDMDSYRRGFGKEAVAKLLARCRDLEAHGLIHIDDKRVVLDKSAFFTSNEICLRLVS